MSGGQGSVKNISQDSQQAFHALINSIAPETAEERDGKLTTEAVEKLSEKLKELIGDEAIKDFQHKRNERGELVNEEGLPIIDITEPVESGDAESKDAVPENASVIQDIPLINFAYLPSVAREKLRRQRDRILDMLEEEERQEMERQERVEREEREELVRKRKEESLDEVERQKKAKELQKKMGKALLRNTGYTEKADKTSPIKDVPSDTRKEESNDDAPHHVKKKTVTFAGPNNSDSNELEWGDVTAARLRTGQRPTLLQTQHPDSKPVKLNVVERKPAGRTQVVNPTLVVSQFTKDSDDESEFEIQSNDWFSNENDRFDDEPAEETFGTEEDDDEFELEDEYDLDYAKHQREIALEYYKKQNIIGQDTARAMMNNSREEDTADYEVPTSAQAKPSISRFKADRLASAYGTSSHSESTSLASSVLPETTARTIQHAIRTGRIDDSGRLVGGEHDSDSEYETENLQQALELLKKSDNVGPDGIYSHTASPLKTEIGAVVGISTAPPADTPTRSHLLSPLDRPKVSRFKADRSQAGRPPTSRTTLSEPTSRYKQPSSQPFTAVSDTIVEKKTGGKPELLAAAADDDDDAASLNMLQSPSFRALLKKEMQQGPAIGSFSSTVIESPSFPRPAHNTTPTPITIIDSPSFPPPGQPSYTRRPDRPPTVFASRTVSDGRPDDPLHATADAASQSNMLKQGRNTPLSSVVKERSGPAIIEPPNKPNNAAPKKVSRFKQARQELS